MTWFGRTFVRRYPKVGGVRDPELEHLVDEYHARSIDVSAEAVDRRTKAHAEAQRRRGRVSRDRGSLAGSGRKAVLPGPCWSCEGLSCCSWVCSMDGVCRRSGEVAEGAEGNRLDTFQHR